MVSQQRNEESIFILKYRDGNLVSIPVSSKKSNDLTKYKKFIRKLRSVGSKKKLASR
jgi:hypothetical protein